MRTQYQLVWSALGTNLFVLASKPLPPHPCSFRFHSIVWYPIPCQLVPFWWFIRDLNSHWFLRLLSPTAPTASSAAAASSSGRLAPSWLVGDVRYPGGGRVNERRNVFNVLDACFAILLAVRTGIGFVWYELALPLPENQKGNIKNRCALRTCVENNNNLKCKASTTDI